MELTSKSVNFIRLLWLAKQLGFIFCHSFTSEMGQQDHLVEIDRKDWPILKQLYLNIPKSFYAYTSIDTYIRWTEQDPNLDGVNIFCLNGNFSDGTFVAIVSFSIFFYICVNRQFFIFVLIPADDQSTLQFDFTVD